MKKNNRPVVIVDLDGTLSDGSWRLHLLPDEQHRHLDAAWATFNLAASDDPAYTDTIDVVNNLGMFCDIVILTGRGAVARAITENWLDKHGVDYDQLIMRAIGDSRKDTVFKAEVVNELRSQGRKILCAFDDLPHIVDMFREMGITTYEVTRYTDHTYSTACKHGSDK
ncbi:hypothetical protein [Pantoea phage LIMEzero]|uniref:Polynucleotide kinase PNKP phosphatase domain-containing protein n=1 Tax=Pantoea phage LIMEzero TaxID=943335 RepID=F4N9T3_9CAUD|nr:polynucleotide kinase [Pantoea phage LIMEzero]CBY88561.1 hypothetical protein [Pantoea phage LIMEzero]